jgi:hypothetical protein
VWLGFPTGGGGDTFTVISPAQLTGNTNNWNPTGLATADAIRVSTDDSHDLTGIVAPAAAKTLLLVNVGDQELQLVHDATSTAANRFICPETSDLTLGEGESVWLVYDMTTARWRVIEVAGGGGAALTVKDEGTPLATAATTLDFVGAGVVASGTGATKTITISGASVSEITDIPTAETDDTLRLAPDGAGGVEWAAGGGGGALYPFESNYFAETKPGSANATYDDEFDDTTGMSGSTNGLDARWNWRNQSTATVAFTKAGWMTLSVPASGSAAWRILEIAALADGTYDAKISVEHLNANDAGGGIVVIDTANGDFYSFAFTFSTTQSVYLQRWTNVTTWSANIANFTYTATGIFLRVVKADTALAFWFSTDGIGFVRLADITSGDVGPTGIGVGAYETNNTGATKLHIDYFRKTA